MTPLSSRATAFSVAALMASASGSKRQEVTATRNHTQSAFRSPQASGPYQSTTTSSPARNVSEDETRYEDQFIRLECGKVQVFLQESSLWRQFYALGTEMIVTKAGRSVAVLSFIRGLAHPPLFARLFINSCACRQTTLHLVQHMYLYVCGDRCMAHLRASIISVPFI